MRLLAVIGSELTGTDERNDWAVLNALVAANGPASIEVRVLALVHRPGKSITAGSPLGRTVTKLPRWDAVPWEVHSPAESARGRLDRALQYLRGLGVRASGDIEPTAAYRAVRRATAAVDYDRVLILVRDNGSWPRRLLGATLPARLRHALDIPVDVPDRHALAPPGS